MRDVVLAHIDTGPQIHLEALLLRDCVTLKEVTLMGVLVLILLTPN
jgi:hypothetical protein